MAIQPVEQGSAFAFRNVINNNFYELKVLSGASKPTQSTAAVVGQMYLDTSEGKMYFCSNVSGSVYTWKPFASDMSASNVSYDNSSSGMSSENVQDAIDELFTSASNGKELIADAITGMGVSTSADDTYATMAGNIEKIETGIDISDATLTAASELKKDIVAYSKTGKRIVGSLGQGTVNKPSISVNSAGKITASTSYTSGIIGQSTVSNTYQLTTQDETTITPGTEQITAVASGRYTTGPVYVAGDENLEASNIKRGIDIFGVYGNCYSISTKENEVSSIAINQTKVKIYLKSLSPSFNSRPIYGIYYESSYGAGHITGAGDRMNRISLKGEIKHDGEGYELYKSDNQLWSDNFLEFTIMNYPGPSGETSYDVDYSYVLYGEVY